MRTTLLITSLLLSLSSCQPEGTKTFFIENDSRYTIYLYGGTEKTWKDSLVHGQVRNVRVISGLRESELMLEPEDGLIVITGISRITNEDSIDIKRDIDRYATWRGLALGDLNYQYTLKVVDEDFN